MDWKGELFCGMHLNWDYKNCTVDLSMPDYTQKALLKFGHRKPNRPRHSPYQAAPANYGSKTPQHPKSDDTPPLTAKQITNQVHTTSCRHFSVLWPCRRPHTRRSLQFHCLTTKQGHISSHASNKTTAQLCRNPPQSHA